MSQGIGRNSNLESGALATRCPNISASVRRGMGYALGLNLSLHSLVPMKVSRDSLPVLYIDLSNKPVATL